MGSGRFKKSTKSESKIHDQQGHIGKCIEIEDNLRLPHCRRVSETTTKSFSSDFSDDSLNNLPVTPDGGWGWVVCFASFVNMVILDGILFSFGILFMELVEVFDDGKGKIAMIGSVIMGVHLIIAPFTSSLINIFNCRKIAMVGSLISALAFVLSSIAPNVPVLILTYGVLGGIGISFVYLPSILIVGFYFEKKRAIANGISNAGSGVGAFIFAPLVTYLCEEYTWRGCMLLTAGIVLHCMATSSLYWSLSSEALMGKRVSSHNTLSTQEEIITDTESSCHTCSDDSAFEEDFEVTEKKIMPLPLLNVIDASSIESMTCLPSPNLQDLRTTAIKNNFISSKSFGNLSLPFDLSTKSSATNTDLVKQQNKLFNSGVINYMPCPMSGPIYRPMHASLNRLYDTKLSSDHQLKSTPFKKNKPNGNHLVTDKPLCRKDIFYSGSVYRLSDCDYHKSMISLRPEDDCTSMMMATDDMDEKRGDACGIITHASVLNTLPDHSVNCGHSPDQAAMLIQIVGISNIFGRLISGGLAGLPQMKSVWINMAALFLGGLTVLFISFTQSYILLVVEVAVFGFTMGTWTSLRPIVLVDLLGIDNLTSALGLCGSFQGVAFSVGTPLSGMLFDVTQSYFLSFLLAAAAFFVSGICCIPMCYLTRQQGIQGNAFDLVIEVSPPQCKDITSVVNIEGSEAENQIV